MSESSVTSPKTAKVYVMKNPELGDPDFDWKVGSLIGEVLIINHDANSFEEAWQWVHENYVRETP